MIISYGWIDEIICVFCKNWISFLVIRTKIDLLPSKQNKTQQNFERKNFDGVY